MVCCEAVLFRTVFQTGLKISGASAGEVGENPRMHPLESNLYYILWALKWLYFLIPKLRFWESVLGK